MVGLIQVWKIDQQLKIWELETSDINVSIYCNMLDYDVIDKCEYFDNIDNYNFSV